MGHIPNLFNQGCPTFPLALSPKYTLASLAIWTAESFPNYQMLDPFCLPVPFSVYLFSPTIYYKQKEETRPQLPHFA